MLQRINIKSLALDLKDAFPEILFAFLFGSAKEGEIFPGSDIDLAIYLEKNASKTDLIPRVIEFFEDAVPGITCDSTILNTTGSRIAFEALRGTMLFIRDETMDIYTDFYSLTCRVFEDESWWMKKQLEYRGYEVQWDY